MSPSSYSSANESQTAFPWVQVPIPQPMNLRLHSHEFLFPCQWTQDSDCIPMSSYLPANGLKTQTAFPWVPIPKPMDSRLRLHSHEFLSPWQILESFGWVPPMSCHPDSGMSIGGQKIAFWRDLRGAPIHTTWVPLKSRRERFRCLLRDFCFWLGFMRISDSSMHDVQYLCGFSKNPVVWLDDLLRGWSPSGEVDGTPDSNFVRRGQKISFWRDFMGTPIHTTWVPLKSRRERFMNSYRRIAFCG